MKYRNIFFTIIPMWLNEVVIEQFNRLLQFIIESFFFLKKNMEALSNLRQSIRLFRLVTSPKLTTIVQSRRNLSKTVNTLSSTSEKNQSENSGESDVEKQINEFQTQIKTLVEKNNDLLDKYKRALADGENMRQRLTKQIQDAKIFGIQSFCKDMLEVADTLGQATKAVPQEEINNNNPHLKNLYDGLVLTKNSLEQVFRRHGLETIEPLNSKFDPNWHEALFQKVMKKIAVLCFKCKFSFS